MEYKSPNRQGGGGMSEELFEEIPMCEKCGAVLYDPDLVLCDDCMSEEEEDYAAPEFEDYWGDIL